MRVRLLVTAAACGSGEDDADDGGSGSGSESEGESGESSGEPIKLGYSAWPGWFVWAVAEDAGIFDEVGGNITL